MWAGAAAADSALGKRARAYARLRLHVAKVEGLRLRQEHRGEGREARGHGGQQPRQKALKGKATFQRSADLLRPNMSAM